VVHRADADRLSPWSAVDPAFARALRVAERRGVRLLAYTCDVTPRGCRIARRIPVELD
jgi:DNA-binding sugar fermentation-stimulating protein